MSGRIRVAKESDAEEIRHIYAPNVIETPISFELEVPSTDEIKSRIRNVLIQHPWLVYEGDAKLLGYAYASAHRLRPAYQWSTEVTVYVDEKTRGQGIGKKLYRKLFEILKNQGYRTAVAGITLPNVASVAIHESLGFRQVGRFESLGYKFGAWHDVGYWQLELQPHVIDPPAPISFPNL